MSLTVPDLAAGSVLKEALISLGLLLLSHTVDVGLDGSFCC
jgi:hypothetical protein